MYGSNIWKIFREPYYLYNNSKVWLNRVKSLLLIHSARPYKIYEPGYESKMHQESFGYIWYLEWQFLCPRSCRGSVVIHSNSVCTYESVDIIKFYQHVTWKSLKWKTRFQSHIVQPLKKWWLIMGTIKGNQTCHFAQGNFFERLRIACTKCRSSWMSPGYGT